MVLSDLYQPDNLRLDYNELLQMAGSTEIAVTSMQAMAAEKNTGGQYLDYGFTYEQEGWQLPSWKMCLSYRSS